MFSLNLIKTKLKRNIFGYYYIKLKYKNEP